MEDIYMNPENKIVHARPSRNQTGLHGSERAFCKAIALTLLSAFLLAGLIGLRVHYTNQLKASLAEITAERDQLRTNLTQMTEELQKLSKQKRACPTGWTEFFFCYLLSNESGSWTAARNDCSSRGAHLVVIGSSVEQAFISDFTKVDAWIGLNDEDKEGTWKWSDGSPLTVSYWGGSQPNNGGGSPTLGEEDCGHFRVKHKDWNDLACQTSLKWICEKNAVTSTNDFT